MLRFMPRFLPGSLRIFYGFPPCGLRIFYKAICVYVFFVEPHARHIGVQSYVCSGSSTLLNSISMLRFMPRFLPGSLRIFYGFPPCGLRIFYQAICVDFFLSYNVQTRSKRGPENG